MRPLESIAPGDYVKILVAYSTDIESRHKRLLDLGIPPDRVATLLDLPKPKSNVGESEAVGQ